MNSTIPHPAGLFSGRMMARMQLGSWATRDSMTRAARRDDRVRTVLIATRNLAITAAFAVIVTVCLRTPVAAPVDAGLFPPVPVPDPVPLAAAVHGQAQMPVLPQPSAQKPSVLEAPAPRPAPPELRKDCEPPREAPTTAPMPSPSAPTLALPVVPALLPVTLPIIPPMASDAPNTTGIRVMTTGYCPCEICCGPGAEGITSIRRDVHRHPRGLAVDPTLIPYRTVLTVPGYGTAMADDTGAAMRHDGDAGVVHIDLRFRTHSQAKAWGVRWVTIEVPDSILAATLATPAADQPGDHAGEAESKPEPSMASEGKH